MSEQPPKATLPPEETPSGYDPSTGLTYKEYLEQGGEVGQALRSRSATPDSIEVSSDQGHGVRPVTEDDLGKFRDKASDEGIGDGAIASMAIEPWTFDEDTSTKTDPPVEAPVEPEASVEPLEPAESIEQPAESPQPAEAPLTADANTDPQNQFQEAYDKRKTDLIGQGLSESEAETRMQDEFTGIESDIRTPYERIGDAVSGRIDELEEGGATSADAHARVHDEFWGEISPDSSAEEPPRDPTDPVDPTEPTEPTEEPPVEPLPELPDIPRTPELERAEAELAIAREEYARMKAGRESSTFFSIKFSSKKVEQARIAYEEAVERAGVEAVRALVSNGLPHEQIRSAVNFGVAVEGTKLIDAQYNHEQQAIDSKVFKGFYKWWSKQSGVKGAIKKGAVMALVAGPIGVGIGIVGAPILAGGGAGAFLGLAGARSITKGLVGNTIKRNASAESVVTEKAERRKQGIADLITAIESRDELVEQDLVNGLLYKQTIDTKKINDQRAIKGMVVSAAIGAGGALLGAWLGDHLIDGDKTPAPGPGEDVPPTNPTGAYDTLDQDRYFGLQTAEPNGAQRANEFFGNLSKNPGIAGVDPEMDAVNKIWEGVKGQLSPDQSKLYNQVVGQVAGTPGLGHAWTINNADRLLDLVKNAPAGASHQDIFEAIQAGNATI